MQIFHCRIADTRTTLFRCGLARVHFFFTIVFFHYQAHKCEQENRKLLKMWNLSRTRLLEVERANFSGEGGTFSHNTADPRKDKEGDEAEKCATSGRSRKRARRSTRKGAPLIQADKEQGAGMLSQTGSKLVDGVTQDELQF